MKAQLAIFLLLLFSAGLSACRKNSIPPDRLPPPTHAGLNTMGCLINGELFIPQENGQTTDTYSGAMLQNISPYRLWLFWNDQPLTCGSSELDIRLDSVSLAQDTTYLLGAQPPSNNDTAHAQWAIFTEEPCSASPTPYNTTAQVTGSVTITWFDPIAGIVAGIFSFDAVNGNGDTVHVRSGRFDMTAR